MNSGFPDDPLQPAYDVISTLNRAIGLLELAPTHPLRQDVATICQHLTRPTVRIAVFGPFNYGKSTLLNAMLGMRALPIDLIPTTGAAIAVRYGNDLRTCIRFLDGTDVQETGTEVLQRFAILDDQRRMRDDVASVEVFCPHPFLQTGVELVDLPGTDDRDAQEVLVKQQLLTADLVVQVLDARKLMTLHEREHLRDWLLDRGIETVVFVVNFVNLLEPEDQQQLLHRLRFVAESFRSALPPGVSNLYRVDALPALRARLKGDMATAQTTGLPIFESALQAIVQGQQNQLSESRLPRLRVLIQSLKLALQEKIQATSTEIAATLQTHNQRIEIKRKAQTLIQQGFVASLARFREWLALPNLLDRYSTTAISALQLFDFEQWETEILQVDWSIHQRDVADWVDRACEFFGRAHPTALSVTFPPAPEVISPIPPNTASPSTSATVDKAGVAIATGLGWVLGGPVGAAVLGGASYLLNQTDQRSTVSSTDTRVSQMTQVYADAVEHYLTQFSTTALSALTRYETAAATVIYPELNERSIEPSALKHQLNLLETTLADLETNLRQS